MNIQKELDFLKEVTLGLLAKKHVQFELKARPFEEGRQIQINLRDNRFTTVGNNLDLSISYLTHVDNVHMNHSRARKTSKKDAASTIKSLLVPQKEEYGSEYSDINDIVDFYSVLDNLSEQIFVSPDYFEMSVSRNSYTLSKKLGVKHKTLSDISNGVENNTLSDTYHVYGGVGFAPNMDSLHGITTSIEFAKSPKDEKYHLGVFSNIADDAKRPGGLYPDATVDMFVETLIEQYQKAWNRTQETESK